MIDLPGGILQILFYNLVNAFDGGYCISDVFLCHVFVYCSLVQQSLHFLDGLFSCSSPSRYLVTATAHHTVRHCYHPTFIMVFFRRSSLTVLLPSTEVNSMSVRSMSKSNVSCKYLQLKKLIQINKIDIKVHTILQLVFGTFEVRRLRWGSCQMDCNTSENSAFRNFSDAKDIITSYKFPNGSDMLCHLFQERRELMRELFVYYHQRTDDFGRYETRLRRPFP